MVEFLNSDTNKGHPFPNNIVVFDANDVNLQNDIKCIFSCVGWEETRLFNPEILDGLYI